MYMYASMYIYVFGDSTAYQAHKSGLKMKQAGTPIRMAPTLLRREWKTKDTSNRSWGTLPAKPVVSVVIVREDTTTLQVLQLAYEFSEVSRCFKPRGAEIHGTRFGTWGLVCKLGLLQPLSYQV